MSTTKIIVVNHERGAPSVSGVTVPGQSQISSGMNELDGKNKTKSKTKNKGKGEEGCEHATRVANYVLKSKERKKERKKRKTRRTHSLYFMLRQSNRWLDEERLLRTQIIEQHLLYARFPASTTKIRVIIKNSFEKRRKIKH